MAPASFGPPSWPLPDTLQVEGQPRFQKRSDCRTDHPSGAGWGAADAGLYVKPSPVFPFQGPLDPDQLNYSYENRPVSPRIFNPSLSCGRAWATQDPISKESGGGPFSKPSGGNGGQLK